MDVLQFKAMSRVLGHMQSWLDDELATLAHNTYDSNLDKDAFEAEIAQVRHALDRLCSSTIRLPKHPHLMCNDACTLMRSQGRRASMVKRRPA